MIPKKCLYRVLGIRPNSSAETIKKAFRRKAMKFHPDRNVGDDAAAAEYLEIQKAYDILSDPERRAKYDATGDTSHTIPRENSELMGILHPTLMETITTIAPFERIESLDLVKRMITKVQNRISQIEDVHKQILVRQKLLNKVIGRITTEGEENLLDSMVKNELDGLEIPLANIKADLDKHTRAINFLKQCKYRMDAGGSPESAFTAIGTTWKMLNTGAM